MSASVLYDAPGPRARLLYRTAAVATVVATLVVAYFVYDKFDETGQWDSAKWKPFTEWNVWDTYLLPGLEATLKAFALAAVLSLVFGLVFGVGRMSQNLGIRLAAGAVVEFFRAVPVLLLMIFLVELALFSGDNSFVGDINIFLAVVLALMFYNGSVLAEVVRAGVNSLPKGQREAGLAIGLSQGQAMRQILLPQALRAMLPAVIAQLVVVLKDTALGFIIGYTELLRQANQIDAAFRNTIPALIVVATIFIVVNYALSRLAVWVESRLRRQGKTAGPVGHGEDVVLTSATAGGMGAGADAGGGAV